MIDKNFFKDHGYTKFSSIPLKVLTNLKLTLFEMLKVSYKKYIGIGIKPLDPKYIAEVVSQIINLPRHIHIKNISKTVNY